MDVRATILHTTDLTAVPAIRPTRPGLAAADPASSNLIACPLAVARGRAILAVAAAQTSGAIVQPAAGLAPRWTCRTANARAAALLATPSLLSTTPLVGICAATTDATTDATATPSLAAAAHAAATRSAAALATAAHASTLASTARAVAVIAPAAGTTPGSTTKSRSSLGAPTPDSAPQR